MFIHHHDQELSQFPFLKVHQDLTMLTLKHSVASSACSVILLSKLGQFDSSLDGNPGATLCQYLVYVCKLASFQKVENCHLSHIVLVAYLFVLLIEAKMDKVLLLSCLKG